MATTYQRTLTALLKFPAGAMVKHMAMELGVSGSTARTALEQLARDGYARKTAIVSVSGRNAYVYSPVHARIANA